MRWFLLWATLLLCYAYGDKVRSFSFVLLKCYFTFGVFFVGECMNVPLYEYVEVFEVPRISTTQSMEVHKHVPR